MHMDTLSYSVLKLSIKPVKANLEAQYADLSGKPILPEKELMTTIIPLLFFKAFNANLVKYTLA